MSRTELVVNLLTRENLFVLVLRDTTPAQIIPRYIIVYQENSPYPNFQEYNLSRDHSMVHQENLFHPSSLGYNLSRYHSMVYQENPSHPSFLEYNPSRDHSMVHKENLFNPSSLGYSLTRYHSMVYQENLSHPSSLEYNPSRDHSMVYQENPFLPCQFSWIQPQQISFHGLLGEPVPSMLVVLLKIYPMFKFVFVFSYYNDVYIHFVFLVRGGVRKILA